MEHNLFEAVFKSGSVIIDLIGMSILLWGFVLSVIAFVKWEISSLSGKKTFTRVQKIRCMLGTYILIGLEFMIISDIIQSFISKSTEDLIFLAAIVFLRTAIGFFLAKELEQIKPELSDT